LRAKRNVDHVPERHVLARRCDKHFRIAHDVLVSRQSRRMIPSSGRRPTWQVEGKLILDFGGCLTPVGATHYRHLGFP
jgi:hypothetical protein